jgi:hypothetical protein
MLRPLAIISTIASSSPERPMSTPSPAMSGRYRGGLNFIEMT